jgi:hypothetical protein
MKKPSREASFDELDALSRVPFDDALDAVGHVQRRNLLVALLGHNPQDDSPAIIVDSKDEAVIVERLVAMNHIHLPKLEEYGFIEWDQDTLEVRKGLTFDEIEPLLTLLADQEDELPSERL